MIAGFDFVPYSWNGFSRKLKSFTLYDANGINVFLMVFTEERGQFTRFVRSSLHLRQVAVLLRVYPCLR